MERIKMETNNRRVTLIQAEKLFERKCKVKNLSEETLRTYHDKLGRFIKWAGNDKLVHDLSKETIEDYILYLQGTGVRGITIATNLRHVRAFLYYCMECGYLHEFKISIPKVEKKIKETYSSTDLEKLLKSPDLKKCSFSEYKVWVFENYLLATGNRISTALSLKIGDIDFANEIIRIKKTKNRKQQIIPLSRTLGDILQSYLEIRGGEKEDYVFCNDYGEKPNKRTFQQLVQNYNIKRGVNCTSCHAFRHTFAKYWILAGGDLARLKTILGHSNIAVTNEYLQMFGQDLQMDFEKFNPLDRLSKNQNKIHM